MSFLDPDDYFLIMYYPPMEFPGDLGIHHEMKYLSGDDLKWISDVGPKTVIIQTNWQMLEPAQGEYHWDYLDKMIENSIRAGMKVLLHEYVFGPVWCPQEWYLQSRTTPKNTFHQLSIWNIDAQEYLKEFVKTLGKRYVSDRVQLICSQAIVGESYLPFMMENAFFDPAAVDHYAGSGKTLEEWYKQSIIDVMLRRHKTLMKVNTFPEIWHSAHHTLGTHPKECGGYTGNGAEFIRDVLDAEREAFPQAKINGIQYTYWFDGGTDPRFEEYRDKVKQDRDKYWIDFYVGAEYCTGLPDHTPRLVTEGLKGFILAPISPCTSDLRLETWMLDNIKNSWKVLASR